MNHPVVITADSTVDLTPELLRRFQIHTIPLTIMLGNESYLDGCDFTPDDLFRRYHEEGILPKTAAPSISALLSFFQSFTQKGYEVVHLDISAELSNVYNAACLAAQQVKGVYVVDSQMLSTGIALLAIEGAECRDKGMDARAIAAHLNELKSKVSTTFVLDTLDFMWKGGRCKGVTAFGANLMRIKPALKLADGKIEVYKKYRGKTEHVYRQYILEQLEGKRVRPGHVFVTESGEIPSEVVQEMIDLVKGKTGCAEVHHTRAGCTVASHCGPKTLGVLYIEE